MQQAGTAIHRVDDMEFGRRLAVDRELELPGPDGKLREGGSTRSGMRVGISSYTQPCWELKVSNTLSLIAKAT